MPQEFIARNGIIGLANSTISGSLAVSQSVIAQSFTGSLSGSATTATTASNALTASYVNPLNQTVQLTGSFLVSGSTIQIGNNTLAGNTVLSGSIVISGSTTSPVTPSIKIYGDTETNGVVKFLPVIKNIDTSISASYIYVSGSTNDLYFSQNGNGFNNVTRLRWLEGNLYTGLLNGGLISQSSSTVYQISSGSGIIVSLNASVNNNPFPTIKYLNWPNLSASIAPLSASFDQTFVGIDDTTNIYTQGTPFSSGQYNTLIPIGIVLHQNHSTINGTKTQPSLAYGVKQRQSTFNQAFGPLKLSGFTVAPSGSSTGSLVIGSGTAYSDGANYPIDPNNPSYITDAGTTVSKIFRYYQSGSGTNNWVYNTNNGAGYPTIDPVNYSNNGTLTPVGASNYSIQRVYWYPNSTTKAIVVYYGNAVYGTLSDAVSNLNIESFSEAPNTAANAIYLGAYAIKGGTNTTLQNTNHFTWLAGGLFRGVSGAGGGGSTVTTTLFGLSDVAISGPLDHQPLAYDTTAGKWTNQSTISASISGNALTATTASYAITASYVLGQSATASYALTASYVQNAQTASYVVTAQTASYVLNAVSSSYAATASYANNFTVGGTLTAQTINVQTITSSIDFVTGSSRFGSTTANTHQFTGSVSVSGSLAVNGSNVILSNQTSSMSVATASYVQNAQTASYILQAQSASYWSGSITNAATASYVVTAQTASYVQNAQTASYVVTAQTASYWSGSIINAATASYVLNAVSSSFATLAQTANTASYVVTAQTASYWSGSITNAATASYVVTAQTASYILQAQSASYWSGSTTNAATASYIVTAQTASYVLNAISSSYATTSSFATTAISASYFSGSVSNAVTANTASYVVTAQTASYVQTAQTASYVQTAQTASYVANAQTASYVLNAISASNAATASYANNFTVGGTLTAQTLVVQTVSSSIVYSSGSNRFGNDTTNTHQFTGSVGMTGSLNVIGSATVTTLTDGYIIINAANINRSGNAVEIQGQSGGNVRFFGNKSNPILFNSSTGNTILGSNTDAGYRLDVAGTTRFQGTTGSDTAPLGSELAGVTATGTNWALAGGATNLNVGGYTHTTGSTTALTTSLAAVSGTYYQITYTITGRTAGSITIAYGGTTTGGITATGNTGPLASSTAVLTITPTTDFDGTVVLSIKSIGTSSASSTFANSSGTSNIEVRASSITSNTFIGLNAGTRNTTGILNTFVGASAGQSNTTGMLNTFLGYNAGQSNTTGMLNTFLGYNAGQSNTTGNSNTLIGYNAGQNNTTGANNVFIGLLAGYNNTTGIWNIAIGGQQTLTTNTNGNQNIAIGFQTLQYLSAGSGNTGLGNQAALKISGGSTNLTSADNSIFIGQGTKALANSQANQIVIGDSATGLGSNTTVLGNSSTVTTAIYGNLLLGTTTDAGYRLDVSGSTRLNGTTTIVSASLNYQENLAVATGSFQTITSAATGSFRSAFFDYVAYSGSIVRAGTLVSTWSGSVTEYFENYTNDLGGSTSVVTLQTAISGSNIVLQAGISGSAWSVRSLVRLL